MANRLLDDIECKWWVRGRYGIGVCASAAELEGPLTQTTALAAARLLQRKHPLLRARIVGNVAPRFEDAGHAEPPVELRELDAVGDWRAIAERELHVPFDVERGPLWRAVIGTTRSDAHAVVFTFHHSIVDGRAQLRIVEQFVALCSLLVADPAADVPAAGSASTRPRQH